MASSEEQGTATHEKLHAEKYYPFAYAAPVVHNELAALRKRLEAAPGSTEFRDALQAVAVSAADGNADALDLLLTVVATHRLSRPAIAKQLFGADDQRDVEQDALIAVARSITTFRGEAHFLTWLHTVATNCALRFVRARQEAVPIDDQRVEASLHARFTSIAATNLAVQRAIDALPDNYRSAVTLRDIENMPYADIAARLDLNLNTVRAHIARGRALVSAALGDSIAGMEMP